MLAELALTLTLAQGPCDCPPPQKESNLWRYFTHATIGSGADLFGTAIAIDNGAIEGNPILKSVEHRVGAKLIYIGGHTAAFWLIEKKLKKPKLALWGSRAFGAYFVIIGIRNSFIKG